MDLLDFLLKAYDKTEVCKKNRRRSNRLMYICFAVQLTTWMDLV